MYKKLHIKDFWKKQIIYNEFLRLIYGVFEYSPFEELLGHDQVNFLVFYWLMNYLS